MTSRYYLLKVGRHLQLIFQLNIEIHTASEDYNLDSDAIAFMALSRYTYHSDILGHRWSWWCHSCVSLSVLQSLNLGTGPKKKSLMGLRFEATTS